MTDYIERYALLNVIAELCKRHKLPPEEEMEFSDSEIAGLLAMIPAADVEPVRHARWIDVQDGEKTEGLWRCSVCGNEVFYPYWAPQEWGDYFCSQCGSKMDGDADA